MKSMERTRPVERQSVRKVRVSRSVPLIVVAGLAGASGCAPMNIHVAHAPAAVFPTSGSYAWVPDTDSPAATGIDVNQLDIDFISLNTRIERAVNRELAAKGYKLAASQAPDFLITYHVTARQRSTWGVGPDFVWVYGADGLRLRQDSIDYAEGTLILNIMDPKTRRVLWHGSAEANIVPSLPPDEKDARIAQAVHAMLEHFPPK